MAQTATRYLEDCLDNRLSFYAYRALYGVNGSAVGNRLLRFHPKLSDRKLLRRKYQENGYIHFFKTARVRDAYRLRFSAAVCLEREGAPLDAARAGNYLDIVNAPDVRAWLGLDAGLDAYLSGRGEKGDLMSPAPGAVREAGRTLLCGPSADMAALDFAAYGTVVLMKPIDLAKYGMRAGQIALILNNQWSIGQKDEVIAWAGRNPGARILSPNRMGLANESAEGFASIPKFPFGSFMGLQRALAILLSGWRFGRAELAGFDFSLSEEAYRPWYPSLILKQYRSHADAFKDTYRKHDFLLNFMYVRRLAEKGLVAGSVLEYTAKALPGVVTLLERKLGGRNGNHG